MTIFKTRISEIHRNIDLRLDVGIRYVDQILDFNPLKLKRFILLGDILEEVKTEIIRKGELEEEFELLELNNIYKGYNLIENVETVAMINSDKLLLGVGDFVVSKMTPRLGTMFINTENKQYLGSTEWVEFRIINDYDPIFLHALLTTDLYLDVLEYLESGKNQRRVKMGDLLKLKIPVPNNNQLNELQSNVVNLNEKLSNRKNLFKIIDDSFKKVTGVSNVSYKNVFSTKLQKVGQDSLSRFSFHNQNYFKSFEHNKLIGANWQFIEDAFTVSGGKRIPKEHKFATTETPYFYLRPTEISLTKIDRNEILNISVDTYNILKRYTINTGEFCVSNVGTLGKVAFINLEELDIETDHLIMSENFLKLTPFTKINHLFYYYYFNSYLFQKQILREYTVTSIMKLGLDKVKKIRIPKFTEEEENNIVSYIKNEMDMQIENLRDIEKIRKDITESIQTHLY